VASVADGSRWWLATGRHGGGGGARAAAQAAALRSDALGQRGVATSYRGARTQGRSDTGCLYGAAQQQCHPGRPIRVRRVAAWPMTRGLACQRILNIRKNSKIFSPHKKNRYKVRNTLGKLMEVGNLIWNTFHDYNFLRFSTNFELFQTF
jgi:hypothetical protein